MEAKFDQIAKNHSLSIHNIEVKMGRLANAVAQRNQGNLPSNIEPNPREQLKVISLRSGKEIQSGNAQGKKAVETQERKLQDGDDDSREGKEKQANDGVQKEPKPISEQNMQKYETRMPFPQR